MRWWTRSRRSWLTLTVAALACLAAAAPAAADWQVVGGGPVAESTSPLVASGYPVSSSYGLKRAGDRVYVAWGQSNGHNDVVHVARLSDDGQSWIPVGGAVNANPAHEAQRPSLAIGPGGVPWVAWEEKDADGARQIRVAHLDQAGDGWVEPDGRDWEINDLPPNYPGFEKSVWSAAAPHITFLGDRPYVTFMQDNPSEWQVEVVRLADDGHSWERVARGVGSSIPLDTDSAVIDGLLHVGVTAGFEDVVVQRLAAAGGWEELGDGPANQTVIDDSGYPGTSKFDHIAGFGDDAYALWTGRSTFPPELYVTHVVDGEWAIAGGGPVAQVDSGTSLRTIGGRLYAAWVTETDRPTSLHVSRLADDGSSWSELPSPDGVPLDRGAVLSSVDGVPYIAWVQTDGDANRLVVERLDGAPAPLAGDDGEGSGPGSDPDVQATSVLPPRDASGGGHCATALVGTGGPDTLTAGPRSTVISGLRGADRLTGGVAGDCVYGGAGTDVVRGRGGEDRLAGGDGGDLLYGGADEDQLSGGRGADELHGGRGWDVLWGNRGDDAIFAADGRGEDVYCGSGDDTAHLDRYDRPHGCEHVKRARR